MKKIILLGAGHSNLEVLKALTPADGLENNYLLISPSDSTQYSGMIPKVIMGEIEPADLYIEHKKFAEKKNVRFLEGKADQVDLEKKEVILTNGDRENFDILSINIGGSPKKIATECAHNTVYLKPFTDFFEKWHYIQSLCSACRNLNFVVVGGGAAAVETAVALKIRLIRNKAKSGQVHLFTRGNVLCPNYTGSISACLLRSVQDIGINVHFNENVESIPDKYLILKSGEKIQFDYIFVTTPNSPSKLEILPHHSDPYGFFLTNKRFELAPSVFVTGDCASIKGIPNLPKSGVIAVHEGRLLAKNIRLTLAGKEPLDFTPPTRTLNIVVDGDNTARCVWGTFSFRGTLGMQLKNVIDERYLNKFRS